jgi:hypothetical protein
VLDWTNAGHLRQPQSVQGVSFALAARNLIQHRYRENQTKMSELIPWLVRDTVLVVDLNEAGIYRDGIGGRAPQIVGLDGAVISNDGGYSDRARLPTKLAETSAHPAIATRLCPLTDLALEV